MILALWFGFLVLASLLVVGGWLIEERPLVFVGLFFFFLLGVLILTNQLEFETGATIVEINSTHTEITYNQSNFTGDYAQWFGFFLAIVCGTGMWIQFVDWKRLRE